MSDTGLLQARLLAPGGIPRLVALAITDLYGDRPELNPSHLPKIAMWAGITMLEASEALHTLSQAGFFTSLTAVMDELDAHVERVRQERYAGWNLEPFRANRAVRELLAARDGMVCGICRQPIDDLPSTHVDHIIPRSLGGSHEQENLQLAHAGCNIRKGNRV